MNRTVREALSGAFEVVIDASIAHDALWGTPARQECALEWLSYCVSEQISIITPPIFAGEMDTAARRIANSGGLNKSEISTTFDAIDNLPVQLILDENVFREVRLRARELAAQLHQPTVYDCTYVALAELRGCNFWTFDKRLVNVASQRQRQRDGSMRAALSCVKLLSTS